MSSFPGYAKLILDGYSEKTDFGVLRSDMDSGIAKQRPRYTTPMRTRSATIMVNSLAERRLFQDWVEIDLFGGTGWFSWRDPIDGTSKQARIVSGVISWTSPGVIWKANCEIETIG